MIVDWYHPDFDRSEPPHIYERTRGSDGKLVERFITPDDADYVKPFCWVRKDVNPRLQSRVCADFPGTTFHFDERAEGIDGVCTYVREDKNSFDKDRFEQEHTDLYEEYTTTGTSIRRTSLKRSRDY